MGDTSDLQAQMDRAQAAEARVHELQTALALAEQALRAIIKTCDEDSGYPNGWSGFVIGAEHVKSLAERGLAKEDGE